MQKIPLHLPTLSRTVILNLLKHVYTLLTSTVLNVPLDETIEICAEALYRGHLDCPPFPEDAFRELMLIATRGVEFSFHNQMYKQLDGVAMGSPLGPALANIIWTRIIH